MKTVNQLKVLGAFRKPGKDGNPSTGQTTSRNLRRRVADYKQMVARPDFRAPDGAFHCPGSLK